MSEPGELFKKAQTMEPLFKEDQVQEQQYQNQEQFLQQNQYQEVKQEVTEEKQQNLEENLANSFKEATTEKTKADNSDPQEPEPAYVSLHASNLTVTKNDSKKMAAVKEAVKRFQECKGTDEEGPSLEAVIKACNSYTWGKFSLFTFGKSKVMLNEVKKVREQAENQLFRLETQKLQKIKEKQEEEKRQREEMERREAEERERREKERIKEEAEAKAKEAEMKEYLKKEKEERAERDRINIKKYFAGELQDDPFWSKIKFMQLKNKSVDLRINELVEKYPTMTDETAELIAETEFDTRKIMDDTSIENDYLAKQKEPRKAKKKAEPAPEPKQAETIEVEKKEEPTPEPEPEQPETVEVEKKAETKQEKKKKKESKKKSYNKDLDWVEGFGYGDAASDVERELERRYNNRNAIQKLYHKLLGKNELRIQVMRDWIKVFKFANDIKDEKGPMLSKNDTDYESTFI